MITADCGHRAWLSPSGQRAVLTRGIRTACIRCLPPGPFETHLVHGAREELAAEIGEDTAEAIIEVVTAFGRARRSRG